MNDSGPSEGDCIAVEIPNAFDTTRAGQDDLNSIKSRIAESVRIKRCAGQVVRKLDWTRLSTEDRRRISLQDLETTSCARTGPIAGPQAERGMAPGATWEISRGRRIPPARLAMSG